VQFLCSHWHRTVQFLCSHWHRTVQFLCSHWYRTMQFLCSHWHRTVQFLCSHWHRPAVWLCLCKGFQMPPLRAQSVRQCDQMGTAANCLSVCSSLQSDASSSNINKVVSSGRPQLDCSLYTLISDPADCAYDCGKVGRKLCTSA